ncbi:MAG: hypothetical protein OXI56_10875 [bacterium]|nr:hypothetical protein [bacterium]MDE0602283.1 hypothetical protein [bacterium]
MEALPPWAKALLLSTSGRFREKVRRWQNEGYPKTEAGTEVLEIVTMFFAALENVVQHQRRMEVLREEGSESYDRKLDSGELEDYFTNKWEDG